VTTIDFQKTTSAQDYLKDPGTPIEKFEHPKLNIEAPVLLFVKLLLLFSLL
jgi:hypothetical protein